MFSISVLQFYLKYHLIFFFLLDSLTDLLLPAALCMLLHFLPYTQAHTHNTAHTHTSIHTHEIIFAIVPTYILSNTFF